MVASWSCTPLFADAHVGFDPAETSGATAPYIVLYALHDAMIRPSPGYPMAPSLVESWSASPDRLVYEFVLRKGVKFHNGDPHVDDRLGLSLPEVVRASDGGRRRRPRA